MIDDSVRNEANAFRDLFRTKGYKMSMRYKLVPEVGPGYIVTVVDPADADSIMFARWYSVDELRLIRTANAIFWRYMI